MAWENGSNLYDYCGSVLVKYTKDKNIFNKALAILQYYDSLNDYPHSLNDLNRALNFTLGTDTNIIGHYLIPGVLSVLSEENKHNLKWDRTASDQVGSILGKESGPINLTEQYTEEILDGFEKDMASFILTVQRSLALNWVYESDPMGIRVVEYYRDHDSKKVLLKFTRIDGTTFQIRGNEHSLGYLEFTLNDFIKEIVEDGSY